MLGARRARKIVNRRHCTHFASDFLVHVQPVQRHKSRGTQEETGRRTDAPRRRPALTGTRDVESHWLWKALGCKKCRMPRRVIYLKCSATYEGNTKLCSPQTTHTSLTDRHRHTARTWQPATGGGRADRADKALSRYGGSRAAQWLLYHRLPDPRAKPSGDHADNRLAYRELCVVAGRLGGRLAATNASVRVMKDLLEAVG